MLQRPAKLVPGAVDVSLDRPEREVQRGRDFFVRPALDATGSLGASLLAFGFALTAVGTVMGIRRLTLAGRRA